MHNTNSGRELSLLRARIAQSPERDRAGLQRQLDTLLKSLERASTAPRNSRADHDAELEALFDNMPV